MKDRASSEIDGASPRLREPSRKAETEVARRRAASDLARESGVLRVNGSSMMPTLAESSWVRFSERAPRVGDIVVFRRELGDLLVHRFLGYRPLRWGPVGESQDPWIVTKPDAAAEFDVEVRRSALLGTVDALRFESSEPWRDAEVSWARRIRSAMWFLRYVLQRTLRRLTR